MYNTITIFLDMNRSYTKNCIRKGKSLLKLEKKHCIILGRGGVGAVVGVLTFYTNNPSSNPAQIYNFSVKIVVEKNKNNEQK